MPNDYGAAIQKAEYPPMNFRNRTSPPRCTPGWGRSIPNNLL